MAETTVFLQYFNDMPDERQPGKVMYPLDEILLLSLLAVLAGADAFTNIARFGERKLDLLRRFHPFPNGTPAHDHLGDIFATLDAEAFQALLRRLDRRADQGARRCHRHRREDLAPVRGEEELQAADPHGL
ncbi:transposase family protein [Methylosinus sp. PW1]|uniref:transposase family protein n=1 Tax=Methylosinus sp. PW1 TaxID=107636 RepID=UPI0018DCBFC6|nr:transposase family protein [Methylosinus sp. PW1]